MARSLGSVIDHVRARIRDLDLIAAPECYAVSEAVYKMAGGKESDLTVHYIPGKFLGEHEVHWFLRGPWGEVIDLTAGQFGKALPPYHLAKRGMFYPKQSRLSGELMRDKPDPLIAAGLYNAWQLQG